MTNDIHALWFDHRGHGPSEFRLELHPFASEMDGEIPATLGIRVRAGDLVIAGGDLVDGGFNLHRSMAEELHRQLGAWLKANP